MRAPHEKNLDVSSCQVYQCLKLCFRLVLYCTTSVVLHYLVCSLRVPFRIAVFEVVQMRYRYTVIQFVCSWSAGRKEIIVEFEKKIQRLIFFSILYIKKESLSKLDLFK